MVAFPSPVLALKWAIGTLILSPVLVNFFTSFISSAVQENLLAADWESDVMLHPDAAEERTGEREGESRILWRGLRVRIGTYILTRHLLRNHDLVCRNSLWNSSMCP